MDAFSSNDPLQPGPLPYAYLNGEHIAAAKAGEFWKYTFRDHLGTLRLRADYPGTVVSRRDYYPFGGEHTSSSGHETHKFTGQERDSETGLDYFVARHYASNLGRFLQPDAAFADQTVGDPRSWNLYTYVRNNPLVFVDNSGRDIDFFTNTSKERKLLASARKDPTVSALIRLAKKSSKQFNLRFATEVNDPKTSKMKEVLFGGNQQNASGVDIFINPDQVGTLPEDANGIGITQQEVFAHELQEGLAKGLGGKLFSGTVGDNRAHITGINAQNLVRLANGQTLIIPGGVGQTDVGFGVQITFSDGTVQTIQVDRQGNVTSNTIVRPEEEDK